MSIFGGLLGTDQINKKLDQVMLILTQMERNVMADFTKLEDALAHLGGEIDAIKTILTSDTADGEKITELTTKVNALSDVLAPFIPAPPPAESSAA